MFSVNNVFVTIKIISFNRKNKLCNTKIRVTANICFGGIGTFWAQKIIQEKLIIFTKSLHYVNDQNKIFKDWTGEKCVRDDKGSLTISDEAKLHAWKEHYQRLLGVLFPWDGNSLINLTAVEGPAIFATENMVTDTPSRRQNKDKQEDHQE